LPVHEIGTGTIAPHAIVDWTSCTGDVAAGRLDDRDDGLVAGLDTDADSGIRRLRMR
jgi:hypothetical protein